MAAIIEACKTGPLQGLIEPALVIASKPEIKGIDRAIEAGIDPDRVLIWSPKMAQGWEAFGTRLIALFEYHKIDLIGQYGWLPYTPANVIAAFEGRIVNQHNAPLDPGRPHFGGDGCYGRRNVCARLYYVRKIGCPEDQFTEATAHYVTTEVDGGAVIGRTRVDILPSDDVFSLQQRLLAVEHQLQIEVLERLGRGTAVPLIREKPLVPKWRVPLLEKSKYIASLLFPHG